MDKIWPDTTSVGSQLT